MKSRIFRALVCFLVICCLVINISPIKANAFALETFLAFFTDDVIMGISLGVLILASGFVPQVPNSDFFQNINQRYDEFIEFELDYSGLIDTDGDGDPDDDDERAPSSEDVAKMVEKSRQFVKDAGAIVREQISEGWTSKDYQIVMQLSNLASLGLGAAIPQFIESLIQDGFIAFRGEAAADGYAYYNGYLFPLVLQSANPYFTIYQLSDGSIRHFSKTFELSIQSDLDGSYYFSCSPDSGREYILTDGVWESGFQYGYIEKSMGMLSDGARIIWANYDVLYPDGSLYLAGSEPLTQEEAYLEAVAVLGETAQGIQNGTHSAQDIVIPEKIDLTSLFGGADENGLDAVVSNYLASTQSVVNGDISLDDYRSSITYQEEDDPVDPVDPSEDPSPSEGEDFGDNDGSDFQDGTLSNTPVLDFFAKLGDLLRAISSGNLTEIGNILHDRTVEIRGDIEGIDSTLQDGFKDVVDSNQELNDSVKDFAEQQQQMMQEQNQIIQEQNQIIQNQSQNLSDSITDGIHSLFTPSDGFVDSKIEDLRENFTFADSIAATALDLRSFLTNLGSVPPVIRINLSAATGSYHYGGDMVLIDFSFYEPYKPMMDSILSSFLWLWFVWRVILSLPGIIGGSSAIVASFNDSSRVGSSGYVNTENTYKPSFVSHPGTDSHYKDWKSSHPEGGDTYKRWKEKQK